MPASGSLDTCRTLHSAAYPISSLLTVGCRKGDLKEEKGSRRQACVTIRFAALEELPSRVKVGQRSDWGLKE